MFKVLVANENSTQRENICNSLEKSNQKLDIISVNSGTSALNSYNDLNPNAFIMDTKFKDLPCNEILEKLSSTKKESKICNIILTAKANEKIFPISNTEKIYKILFKPIIDDDLNKTVSDIYIDSKIPEIDKISLKLFLLDLKFNIHSLSTKYLIEAIYQCYYYPNLLENLDDIINLIAFKFNTNSKTVKAAFRNALRPINIYRKEITQSTFINLFDPFRNITPKYFLEVITMYLYKIKSQKY